MNSSTTGRQRVEESGLLRAASPRLPIRRALVFAAPLLPLLAIAIAWWSGGLARFDSPERIAEVARSLQAEPWAIAFVLLGFAAGTLLFFPVTALIVGTTLAFEPWQAVVYSLLGVLAGATTTYWCGRLFGGRVVDYLAGPRVDRFRSELQGHAFRASIIARILPVGNFTVINLLIGSMRIPFRAYFFGNIVGALPGIIAITLFADQLGAALRRPNATNMTVLAAFALLLIALMWWLRRTWSRRERPNELG